MPFSNLNSAWSDLSRYYNTLNNNGSFIGGPNNPNVTNSQKPQQPKPSQQYKMFDDGFIRGGILNAALSTTKDVVRVGNFLKSSKGLIWLAKQAGLQLSNPRLEWRGNPDKPSPLLGGFNRQFTGIGIGLSVAGNAFGLHFDQPGLLGIVRDRQKYGGDVNSPTSGVAYYNNFDIDAKADVISDKSTNRLLRYAFKLSQGADTLEKDYLGGARSVYGIGAKSTRPYYLSTDGVADIDDDKLTLTLEGIYNYFTRYKELSTAGRLIFQNNPEKRKEYFKQIQKLSPSRSGKFIALAKTDFEKFEKTTPSFIDEFDFDTYNHGQWIYQNIQSQFGTSTSKFGPNIPKSSYKIDAINVIEVTDSDTFFNYDVASATETKKLANEVLTDKNYKGKINGYYANDIVPFRIEFLNNEDPGLTDILAFRAYINDFSDGMQAKWNPYRYMGRGEEFYVYEGFTRDMSVDFTIYAHSPEEMRPIYRKLNYLMSSFTPDYSAANKMRGNVSFLTIGNYIWRQPGVFTDIKLSGMLDTHWEIGVGHSLINVDPDTGETSPAGNTKYPGTDLDEFQNIQLPKYIKVTLSFKPIHKFLPRKENKDRSIKAPFVGDTFLDNPTTDSD